MLSWSIRSAWALAGAFLVLWTWKAVHAPSHSTSVKEQVASQAKQPERGSANLVETASQTTPPPMQEPSERETISQDPPPEPFPRQITPDAKGRCPGPKQIPLNGGCWVEYPSKDAEKCEKNSLVFLKGRCYGPVMGSRRKPPPTSAPPDFR